MTASALENIAAGQPARDAHEIESRAQHQARIAEPTPGCAVDRHDSEWESLLLAPVYRRLMDRPTALRKT